VTQVGLLVLHDSEVKMVLAWVARCGSMMHNGERRAQPGQVAGLTLLG
jgi:hypothetical protein